MRRLAPIGTAILAGVVGILVGLIVIALSGASPTAALRVMLSESLGGLRPLNTTVQTAIPLAFAGLGVAIAYRAGLFNIGGEGQLVLGALAASMATVWLDGTPGWIALPLIFVVGVAAGALWGALPGVMRAYRQVSEIVSTIMLNFVALGLVGYLVRGPLLAPGAAFPQTERVPAAFELPEWQGFSLGGPLAVIVALVAWGILFRTRAGLRYQAVGRNAVAAKVVGISERRVWIVSFAIAGGLLALAGIVELLAVQHRVSPGFSPGFGFTGLLVAFLGRAHPAGVLPAALFMAFLETSGGAMERQLDIPSVTVFVMQAAAAMMAVALPLMIERVQGALQRRERSYA